MMRATQEFGYQSKILKAGDTFEPANEAHRRQLLAIKRAENVTIDDQPKKKKKKKKDEEDVAEDQADG